MIYYYSKEGWSKLLVFLKICWSHKTSFLIEIGRLEILCQHCVNDYLASYKYCLLAGFVEAIKTKFYWIIGLQKWRSWSQVVNCKHKVLTARAGFRYFPCRKQWKPEFSIKISPFPDIVLEPLSWSSLDRSRIDSLLEILGNEFSLKKCFIFMTKPFMTSELIRRINRCLIVHV